MAEQTQTEKLKEQIARMLGTRYPGHYHKSSLRTATQILKIGKEAGLSFVEVVTPPSLQDPGADTYPIVREIEI